MVFALETALFLLEFLLAAIDIDPNHVAMHISATRKK